MQKLKSIKWGGLLNILKCCMVGIVATLIGIVIFAIILKFADLSNTIICYVNDIIKTFSIFIMVMCIKKVNDERLLVKSIFGGILYAILSFVVFSIMNGAFTFNLSFLYDLLFAVIVSVIASVIINLLSRKSV